MSHYKINSPDDDVNFISTYSYKILEKKLKNLKKERGNILHVLGAPGTGKSTNIYHAVQEEGLTIFQPKMIIDEMETSPRNLFYLCKYLMKDELKVKDDSELYNRLKEFDIILFADKFHDYHLIEDDKIGFSQWTVNKGWKAIPFYYYCVKEFFKHHNDFKDLNLVFQTSWRVHFGKKKFDLFTELGVISLITRLLLGLFFQIAMISYTPNETISIVKSHIHDVDSNKIRKCIDKYGCKPRLICENLNIS